MTRRACTTQADRTDRGYALILALLLLGLVTLTLGWNLRRLNVYGASVQVRADGYLEHHERLGVRDLATVWASRVSSELEPDEMLEMADDGAVDFEVFLPDGTLLELFLRDGQASFLANFSLAEDASEREEMLRVLAALPSDRPDLVRMAGPREVSIRSVDDVLIDAMADGDSRLGLALRELRDRPDVSRNDINTVLSEMDVDRGEMPPSAGRLTFDPALWAIDVRASEPDIESVSGRGPRWYRVLIELGSAVPKVREWRRLSEREFVLARGERFEATPPPNRVR